MTNQWQERFSSETYLYGKEPNRFVVEAVPFLPKGKVLCIAEGEGRNSVYLAGQGFEVTTWDYAPAGIEKTRRLATERGVTVHTELHDLADVGWEQEQWDVIVHIFGHFPKSLNERTTAGIQKALKPGGHYVCELYTKEQLRYKTGGPSQSELLCDPQQLLASYADYFTKHFYIGEVERVEGIGHTGRSHVVQAIFQKREE